MFFHFFFTNNTLVCFPEAELVSSAAVKILQMNSRLGGVSEMKVTLSTTKILKISHMQMAGAYLISD